ncbi:hypothetical protein [Microcoleus vaginatus]|uniref:hypothetical protein n=1 Tax=Microcoleus vaginatus TaxID=119532 RepID=UPI004040888F
MLSKCALSVFGSQRAGVGFQFSLPPVWGCENLSGSYQEIWFLYEIKSLQPPAKADKPGKLEFLGLSFLVISIADSEFWQALSQQFNNY